MKIRPRPQPQSKAQLYDGPYYICKDLMAGQDCTYPAVCTFAYNQEEIDVWTVEKKGMLDRCVSVLISQAHRASTASDCKRLAIDWCCVKVRRNAAVVEWDIFAAELFFSSLWSSCLDCNLHARDLSEKNIFINWGEFWNAVSDLNRCANGFALGDCVLPVTDLRLVA